MEFYIHKIKSKLLQPFVQYILFNNNNDPEYKAYINSFANTNFCLGIINQKQLTLTDNGNFTFKKSNCITSYITGIYQGPYKFYAEGEQDEICIDFTPLGFYQFFKFPAKTFILNEDILNEGFGTGFTSYFNLVFEENDLGKRGELIEKILILKLKNFTDHFLAEALSFIHVSKGCLKVSDLSKQLNCSERKLLRRFSEIFDISPKDYIKVVRFRHVLELLMHSEKGLANHAYELNFSDQSHLSSDFKFYTGFPPKQAKEKLTSIDDTVYVSLN